MKANHENLSLPQLRNLYDEVELAIIFDWLKIKRPTVLCAVDIETVSSEAEETEGSIRLITDMDGKSASMQ